MKLGMLVQLQEAGVIKVAEGYSDTFAVVGTSRLNREQCNLLASKLGWIEHDMTSMQVIEKTHKFINGLKKNIVNSIILENTEVTFQNRRKTNTESYFDRIKLICPGYFDITVLYGMPGVGGAYGIYSATNNFSNPVKACRTLKEVSSWINDLV